MKIPIIKIIHSLNRELQYRSIRLLFSIALVMNIYYLFNIGGVILFKKLNGKHYILDITICLLYLDNN